MPNVTISVPADLKIEMDGLREVNWSEVSRKAIRRYIEQRKNPAPRIELDLNSARLDPYDHQIGYPTLHITMRIHNTMESEIVVDRILFIVRFIKDSVQPPMGRGYDLYRRTVISNSSVEVQMSLILHKERIKSLKDFFTSSFYCRIRCIVFVEGFEKPYSQELSTRIPIDDWEKIIEKTLKPS